MWFCPLIKLTTFGEKNLSNSSVKRSKAAGCIVMHRNTWPSVHLFTIITWVYTYHKTIYRTNKRLYSSNWHCSQSIGRARLNNELFIGTLVDCRQWNSPFLHCTHRSICFSIGTQQRVFTHQIHPRSSLSNKLTRAPIHQPDSPGSFSTIELAQYHVCQINSLEHPSINKSHLVVRYLQNSVKILSIK